MPPIIKRFLSTCIVSILPFCALALDGGSHAGYMWRILPFEENDYGTSNLAVSELFELMLQDFVSREARFGVLLS